MARLRMSLFFAILYFLFYWIGFFSVLYLHKVPTFFLPSALKGIVYEEEMLIYFSFFVWSLLCDWPSHCLIVSINASYVKAGSMVQLV